MDEKTYKKVLSKVRKLLKLSEGKANLNESATAAEMAQRLIEEYRIKQTELELEDEGSKPKPDIFELYEYDGPKVAFWKVDLAGFLGQANGCGCYYEPGHVWYDKERKKQIKKAVIRLAGTKKNFSICFYMFFYLMTTIEVLCKQEGKGKGRVWAQSFRIGAVHMIRDRLQEAKRKAREKLRTEAAKDAPNSVTALVRLDTAIAKVDGELNEALTFMRGQVSLGMRPGSSVTIDEGGYKRGQKAAKSIPLDPRRKGKLTSGKPQNS